MKSTDPAQGARLDGGTRQQVRSLADAFTSASPMVRRQQAAAAWERWSVAAGPWRRWTLCLPLLGPGLDELASTLLDAAPPGRRSAPRPGETIRWAEVARLSLLLATRLAAPAPRTLVVLDVAPVTGVLAAAALHRLGWARPALCLARWPYAEAVLPVRPLVDVLLAVAPQQSAANPEPPHVVLVLDGQRGQPVSRHRGDPRADNRFEIASEDLPDSAMLAAEGISRVLDARAESQNVPGALQAAYAAYAGTGQVLERLAWKLAP